MNMKIISWILCLLAGLMLCSCVYDVPLVAEAVVPVDSAVTGTWQLVPEEGKAEEPDGRIVVLPFSATEYVVICSPGEKDQMIFRAYPVRIDDLQLIQLEWLNDSPELKNRYHVCRYILDGGMLTVKTLNDKIVGSGITDSKALRETLLANRDNPDLFQNPQRYRKIED